MKWVDASPSAKTMFEQFLLEHFGIYTSLSTNQQWLLAAVIAVAIPSLVMFWNRSGVR